MPYNPCIDMKHREELEHIGKEGLKEQAKLDAERKAYIEAIARHTHPDNLPLTSDHIRDWVNIPMAIA